MAGGVLILDPIPFSFNLGSKSQRDFRTKQTGLLESPPIIDVFPIESMIFL